MIMESKKTQGDKLKLQLLTSDELWEKVLRYKLNAGLKNNSKAVEELIKKALEQTEKYKDILTEYTLSEDALAEIGEFRLNIPTYEKKHSLPLLIFLDKKSGAFYTECHILSSDFIRFSDPDIVIDLKDQELQEEERANREIEEENFYFIQMKNDAQMGRSFSDMITEYDTSYKEEKPLKILGGQHRDEAIKMAVKNKVNVYHGIKVYFNLTKDQKVEIMRIANTNINVADDLRDRLQEETLNPTGMLREFARETGLLGKDENFSDKRRYEEEFSPSVRMIRSFIVNFFKGEEYQKTNEIDKDAVEPSICKSGKDIDKEYLKYFNKFSKTSKKFDDDKLIEAGKMFTKLHKEQYEKADSKISSVKKQYQIKSFNLAIITSWAFASGVLQRFPERLKKLYVLPELNGEDDPLNASAMSNAKHRVLDENKNYRGLGTRSDASERGRLLHLFLLYSLSKKPKIDEQMCNSAIQTFHSNKDSIKAEESRKKSL